MAVPRPGNGKPFAPGPYSHGGHSLVLAKDGGIKVEKGDTVSGYSACLYRDLLVGWEEYGKATGGAVKPLDDPNLITAGDTIYHIPTWQAVHPPVNDQYKQHALALVDAFAARTGPRAFLRLSRSVVAHGLRQRVLNPTLVNQGAAALCPSASVVYLEARDHPVRYVLFVIQLFELGRASIHTWRIAPSRDLKNYLPPVTGIHEADWIPMASIRESEEWFWSNRDIFSKGGAFCDVLARWLIKAGYTDVRDNSQKSQTETERNLRLAGAYYDMGYMVILNIDAAVFEAPANRPKDPNEKWMHIVTLTSPISFFTCPDGSRAVDFTVQTWGAQKKMIPDGAPFMQLGDFLAHYYGFVAARF
jgi:hypothetical protein